MSDYFHFSRITFYGLALKLDRIHNITIFGVGLIGGSLGLALKKYGFNGSITGLGRRMSTLKIALERDAVDRITLEPSDSAASADLLVVAIPVESIPDSMKR
ncbi:MAG: prephenate dehydrogenase/arogenate dehydrogenase family protein [bacterium]